MPLKGEPTRPKKAPVTGGPTRFVNREIRQLSPTTFERIRTNPSPLAKRFTKFRQDFSNPIAIPKNLMHPDRMVRDAKMFLDVGQIPED
jgi:hypothetical protein